MKPIGRAAVLLVGAAVGVLTAGAGAEEGGSVDSRFALKAASAGLLEVKLGQLAADRASSAEVKMFAARMVDEHLKSNLELATLATVRRWTLPKEPDAKHQAQYDKLAKLSGPDFDRMYARQMVENHQEAVKLFEKEIKNGQDEQLIQWATKTLAVLKEHLKLAQKLKENQGP